MYIRFESTSFDSWSRSYEGLFQVFGGMDKTTVTSWHLAEINRECDWFNDNLRCPRRFFYRPHRKGEVSGVCWFRASAQECVNRARYLAWMLNDIGVRIDERKSESPGRVLWQDDYQVVASMFLER